MPLRFSLGADILMFIMKHEIAEKAWELSTDNLEEGWYQQDLIYYGTRGRAKISALIDNGCAKTIYGEELTFINIKVKRSPLNDKVVFEGVTMPSSCAKYELNLRKRKELIKKSNSEFFYVQDNRNYVGNSVLWRGQNSNGYVCHLPDAHRYTKKEIINGFPWRESDIIWDEKDVLMGVRQHVDMQYLHRQESI